MSIDLKISSNGNRIVGVNSSNDIFMTLPTDFPSHFIGGLGFVVANANGTFQYTQNQINIRESTNNVGIGTQNQTNAKVVIRTDADDTNETALALQHGDNGMSANQYVMLSFGQSGDADDALARIGGAYSNGSFNGHISFFTNQGAAGAANLSERMRISKERAEMVKTPFRAANMTTTERNALTNTQNGDIIYNTTDNQFQGYRNGAWVNFNLV